MELGPLLLLICLLLYIYINIGKKLSTRFFIFIFCFMTGFGSIARPKEFCKDNRGIIFFNLLRGGGIVAFRKFLNLTILAS